MRRGRCGTSPPSPTLERMHRRRIEQHPSRIGGTLGRHVEHDPRSRTFRATLSPEIRTVRHRRYGHIFDQGELGSCTGNALAGALNTVPTHRRGVTLHEPDAVSLYAAATALDSFDGTYPPDDTGSSGLAVCKAGVAAGYLASYQHTFTVEEALAALTLRSVITGVAWYESFDRPDADGIVTVAGEIRGGHEFEMLAILRVGATLDDTVVEAANSWGDQWAVRGRFRMTAKTWASLLEQEGDVTVPVAA